MPPSLGRSGWISVHGHKVGCYPVSGWSRSSGRYEAVLVEGMVFLCGWDAVLVRGVAFQMHGGGCSEAGEIPSWGGGAVARGPGGEVVFCPVNG
jgi:hypothetical protein